jgi:phospholipid/cholesterol/gamma-HCH transport system substrate-binding protein
MAGYARGRDVQVVAALAIAGAIAFTVMFMHMTDRALSLTQSDIYVRLASAEGLRKADPVFFRGVDVGKVTKFILQPDGSVLVKTRLTQRVPMTVDGRAGLVAVDMFGRQSLVLREGTADAPLLLSGDTITGMAGGGMTGLIAELGENARELTGESTVMLVHGALEGMGEATRSMSRLGDELRALAQAQQQSLTLMTGSAATVAANLEQVTDVDALVRIRDSTERTGESMAVAAARMDTTMASLTALLGALERGEGSAGLLLRDTMLVKRTEALLIGLEALVVDLKANPKRYVNFSVF